MSRFLLLLLTITFSLLVFSQNAKKEIIATRCSNAPHIDGTLNEEVWQNLPLATDFIQYEPANGQPSTQKTEVKILFDDAAIYIGAVMYDNPDSILKYLSKRDEFLITDMLGIYIDPFNDAQNAFGFFVTSAGVQIDAKSTTFGEDFGWDAVWKSAVQIEDFGWVVEMEIPYSALRFPKTIAREWGLNMFRKINRHRETSTWNYVDISQDGFNQQAGILKGIENVESPVRLAFVPYTSAYLEKDSDSDADAYNYSLKGGMDVKYGINESFTLDMMLIPDFGQVQSDDEILNLSPFETFYDEKRAFFTEGIEMFQKADIFYSRRIGGKPASYDDVEDNIGINEEIDHNPSETQLINATKISGKTKSGLGVGFLNAMTLESVASIKDTITGETRDFVTQPFTNYNVLVLDQSLKNNSYASLINTNVNHLNNNYTANVTGTDIKLFNKENSYYAIAKGALSQLYENDKSFGFYTVAGFGKSKGNFKFEYENAIISDTYDPNDFGYLQRNNEMSNELTLRYNIYKPVWNFIKIYNTVEIEYTSLYNPRVFNAFELQYHVYSETKNHTSIGLDIEGGPIRSHDYYEPRVEGRYLRLPKWYAVGGFVSTDYSKKFALDIFSGIWGHNENNTNGYWLGIEPRIRINDKMILIYRIDNDQDKNLMGYVDHTENEDTIYFGKRMHKTLTNTANFSYIFNNKSSLSFRLRHYWSRVDYTDFYTLNSDGTLTLTSDYTENEDINYNAFTIDLVYTWNFAPGSELLLVWKNNIDKEDEILIHNFRDNLNETWRSPQTNSFSIKLLYYLDYWYLVKK